MDLTFPWVSERQHGAKRRRVGSRIVAGAAVDAAPNGRFDTYPDHDIHCGNYTENGIVATSSTWSNVSTLLKPVWLPHPSLTTMTYRKLIWDHAVGSYGFITTDQAKELGVPPIELAKMAQRGGLTSISYGLYRVDDVPMVGYEPWMEAVLRVGKDAHLTHDAVLALHDLALVDPRIVRVGTPHRTQAKLPSWIRVIKRRLPPEALTVYEGIPATTVAQALIDCRGIVMRERLVEAVDEARERGLIRRGERPLVRETLGIPSGTL